ncbi:MAG TPA: hypothetical protein VLS45_08915 [Methylomicrobium sp.]|nr:hypothetical protein [Methylomicrobium sp.]
MNEQKFQRNMSSALTALALGVNPDYARGYERGLMRLYLGESFGTPAEHKKWMQLSDEWQQLGDGYRDGFAGKSFEFQEMAY